jgi:hypothetical protein
MVLEVAQKKKVCSAQCGLVTKKLTGRVFWSLQPLAHDLALCAHAQHHQAKTGPCQKNQNLPPKEKKVTQTHRGHAKRLSHPF